MRLDSVELVMEIEDPFGISIPDDDASRLTTVGEIYDYLTDRLTVVRTDGSSDRTNEQIWQTLQKAIVKVLQVKPEQVMRDAHLIRDLGMN